MHAAALVVVIAVVAFSLLVGRLVGWACSSGEEAPGSFEADLCDGYAGSLGFTWWLAVLWPAIAFGASQIVPIFRRRPLLAAATIAVVAMAFWITTAVLVVDVG